MNKNKLLYGVSVTISKRIRRTTCLNLSGVGEKETFTKIRQEDWCAAQKTHTIFNKPKKRCYRKITQLRFKVPRQKKANRTEKNVAR